MEQGNRPTRKNVATITPDERKKFRDAIIQLGRKFYPGSRDDFMRRDSSAATDLHSGERPCPSKPAGHVSYWFKQDEIHQATHVHGGPAFLPWHRELCNRFEDLLQEVDPKVALHYWDWSTDPRTFNGVNLFSTGPDGFMGSADGRVGSPLDFIDNNGVNEGSRGDTQNAADPPRLVDRKVNRGFPGKPTIILDEDIVHAGDNLSEGDQYLEMSQSLEVDAHGTACRYVGGNIGSEHNAFEDPFVFLIHSNVDRLWASWQLQKGKEWRLDPERVYGILSTTIADPSSDEVRILTPLAPWCGIDAGTPENPLEKGVCAVRPWAPPENQQVVKNSKHPSIVVPRSIYDVNVK
jgi:hypothetical protein